MDKNYYPKVMNELQAQLNAQLKKTISVLSGDNKEEKIEVLKELQEEIKLFSRLLPKMEIPEWLSDLAEQLKWANQNHLGQISYSHVLESLLRNTHKCLEMVWEYDEEIDFEAIYKKYRDASQISTLFDTLIEQLVSIIDDGKLDNEIVVNGIERLTSIIRQNMGKSLYSDQSLVTWVVVFMKNFVVGLLKEIPGLKNIIEAIEKTLSELNREVIAVSEKSAMEISTKTTVSMGILYGRNGENALPNFMGGQIKLLV